VGIGLIDHGAAHVFIKIAMNAQVALNWLVWFNGEVVAKIPSATKVQQDTENSRAMRCRPSDAELPCMDQLSISFR
jgi:aryl-alcohol dehydrogenase-like predicted oxidoreductase